MRRKREELESARSDSPHLISDPAACNPALDRRRVSLRKFVQQVDKVFLHIGEPDGSWRTEDWSSRGH